MLLGICAALGAAVIYGGASILQAMGSRQVQASAHFDPLLVFVLLRRPAYVASLVMMCTGFLLHLVALQHLPLYLAQSVIAASLAVTAVLAVTVYGERLHGTEWAAVAAVIGGLALLTAAGGTAGSDTATPALKLALVLIVGIIVAGGVVAARVHTRSGTASLGLLAGLGYAVVGVSGRVLPPIGLGMLGSPVLYTLGLGGGLAFLLYSQALQRGAVTTVTGPMIAVQTAVPSLVGVLLLDDAVRSGWGVVALAGFALAAAGTLVLVRFESGPGPAPPLGAGPSAPSADRGVHGEDQASGGGAEQAGQGGVGDPRPVRRD